jgi:anti-sigma B factor antagonist
MIQEVGDELYSVVEEIKPPALLIDFAMVQYLGSAATGKLINLKKKARRNPTRFVLCRLHPDLLEVFRMSRLDMVFAIFEHRETALAALANMILVGCPLDQCGGWARSDLAGVLAVGHELRCSNCNSRFRTWPQGGSVKVGELSHALIESVSCHTYDDECINLSFTWGTRIAIIGRLDLFASEALERVWRTVPPPRRIVLDLRQTTEWSRRGLDALHGLRGREAEGELAAPSSTRIKRSRRKSSRPGGPFIATHGKPRRSSRAAMENNMAACWKCPSAGINDERRASRQAQGRGKGASLILAVFSSVCKFHRRRAAYISDGAFSLPRISDGPFSLPKSRTRLLELTGHQDRVNLVTFSPDGRRLASGSDERTVARTRKRGHHRNCFHSRPLFLPVAHRGRQHQHPGVTFDPALRLEVPDCAKQHVSAGV